MLPLCKFGKAYTENSFTLREQRSLRSSRDYRGMSNIFSREVFSSFCAVAHLYYFRYKDAHLRNHIYENTRQEWEGERKTTTTWHNTEGTINHTMSSSTHFYFSHENRSRELHLQVHRCCQVSMCILKMKKALRFRHIDIFKMWSKIRTQWEGKDGTTAAIQNWASQRGQDIPRTTYLEESVDVQ